MRKKPAKTINHPKVREIDLLKHRITELEANWKRALADYQNLEKRIQAQQSTFIKLANASLIDKLLSVLDDLERATTHLQNEGLNLILKQFKDVLKTEGVAEIEALNQTFNPETMDCVELVPGKKNLVAKVVTKGYQLNGQTIRPAKVMVGKGK